MKKSGFLLVVLALIGSLTVFAQDKAQNVKKVRVMEQKFDKKDSSPELDSEATYDDKGNIIEETKYKNGKVSERISYKYDPQGNKTSETKTDKTGAIIEIIEYKNKGQLRVEKIVYDGKRKMLSKKTYEYEFN